MSTLQHDEGARAKSVRFARGRMIVDLADGRTLELPVEWFPRLHRATPGQRRKWQLIDRGVGIHWPLVDEDLSVAGLMRPYGGMRRQKRRAR
jgi:Protein of unknown function (DUF2442)